MSMTINLVEDHNIYLCEGGPVYNGGVQPTPITYLTQWKIVGNSEVHGVGNLTSWKVSGNSVVDNNAILSCGDLEQDGKYHVKISNGVTIFDIPLDAPLRKVNDVVDTIEFPSGTDGKALVTRCLTSFKIGNVAIIKDPAAFRTSSNNLYKSSNNHINNKYPVYPIGASDMDGFGVKMAGTIFVFFDNSLIDGSANNFKAVNKDVEIVCELATPTTELVDVSPFPVSPTDTYTSANAVPYSAFEHTENKEIWSCGEYNSTDGKYHILVQPLGGSIADIALDAPLRKVNDVADTIEFPSGTDGKALVTRPLKSINIYDYINSIIRVGTDKTSTNGIYAYSIGFSLNTFSDALPPPRNETPINGLCSTYIVGNRIDTYGPRKRSISISKSKNCNIYDPDFDGADDIDAFKAYITEVKPEFIYELATPTTELVDAPQIEEADSYSMVISQGGKAVSWSSFETSNE